MVLHPWQVDWPRGCRDKDSWTGRLGREWPVRMHSLTARAQQPLGKTAWKFPRSQQSSSTPRGPAQEK